MFINLCDFIHCFSGWLNFSPFFLLPLLVLGVCLFTVLDKVASFQRLHWGLLLAVLNMMGSFQSLHCSSVLMKFILSCPLAGLLTKGTHSGFSERANLKN